MKKAVEKRSSERGGAGIKFLLVMLGLFLVGNAGFQYIPVLYSAENFKQEMQTAVIQAFAMPGQTPPADRAKKRIINSLQNNNIPLDAVVDVKQVNNVLSAHVVYTKEIPLLPFGLYEYQYHFDHTATPSGFLTKE